MEFYVGNARDFIAIDVEYKRREAVSIWGGIPNNGRGLKYVFGL